MRLATWNVQSMTNKYTEVTDALNQLKIDIAILSETKKKGTGTECFLDYFHLWSGVNKSERAATGIAIMINKNQRKYIKNYNFISERIVTLTISMYRHETVIIGIYAPNNDANAQTKDMFYQQLEGVLDRVKQHNEVILAGDFSARSGSKQDDEVIGKYGESVTNTSGEMLIEFCKQYELKILNGYFAHKDIHKYTWERPSVKQRSIIDKKLIW